MNWFIRYVATTVFFFMSLTTAMGVELRIKPGNTVHITVLGHPELSQVVLVRQDGTTEYPLLANIPIDGMTVHSLHEMLLPVLVRFIERPKLFINIGEHRKINVTVEGQVRIPGTHMIIESISLQGVLAISGGTTKQADLRHITINRKESGSYREILVDLYHFYANSGSAVLPEIKDGDIIFVPMATNRSSVRVMGLVNSPGSFIPIREETIADMIYRAGGAKPNAKMNAVIYLAYKDGKHKKSLVNLNKMINKGLTDEIPIVNPGDIIIVGENKWYQKPSWYVSAARDLTIMLSTIIVLSRIIN